MASVKGQSQRDITMRIIRTETAFEGLQIQESISGKSLDKG